MLRVRTSCGHTAALIERYACDVSPSGVFVRTRDAFEQGAVVRFEYLLANGRCALAGEGRVAFRRSEDEVGASAAGIGIAIEKLRKGDRAVVERMSAARGAAPSRFEQPAGQPSVAPRSSLRADALFADVTIASTDAPSSVAAYLSADLTTDLPTVRPPPSTPAPVPLASAPRAIEEPGAWSGDLADQLEPAPERISALDAADVDATPAFVPLSPEEAAVERSERSSRPSRPSASHRLRAELAQTGVTRATDPDRERRFAELMASAAHDQPPSARMRVLLPVLVVLVVFALLGLAFVRGALDPWLPR